MGASLLLIRADASVPIGTGHVMRCLALAQAWVHAGGVAVFAAAEIPTSLRERLTGLGFSLVDIRAEGGSLSDAFETIANADRLQADWVAIDGDRFGSAYLDAVSRADRRVLLIDDFADRESFPCELIVNPNLGAAAGDYQVRGFHGAVMAGSSYVLLRPEFRLPDATDRQTAGNRVLITLGGSDPENLTPRIAAALKDCGELEISVVVGAAYPHVDELQRTAAQEIRVLCDARNMAALMHDADIAIIAAGGTLWELLSMGCAVLSYSRNVVQARVVSDLAKAGVVVDLGDTSSFDPQRLAQAVKGLAGSATRRQRMVELGRKMIDGLGASRVVEALLQRRGHA